MAAGLTLGSLFDGIGGFCYAAQLTSRITPIWAAEIEPSCIDITRYRFPEVMHVGSVTELKGDEIQPVDIITFGSPCQDLSIAGQRKGLKGNRSGLFMEAIRIIEEMRLATNGKYPTFIIWENVPGAFSSRDGADFRAVLEKVTKTDIPMPASGRWATAGMVRGGEADAAWRVLDAQFWGVPQRRKRIYLVGDFGGQRAGEILFKSESLLGYTPKGKEQRQGIAGQFADGVGTDNKRNVIPLRGEVTRNKASNGFGVGKAGEPCPTLTTADVHSVFYEAYQYGRYRESKVSGTLTANRAKQNGNMGILAQEIKSTMGNTPGKPKNIKDILKKAAQRVTYIIRRLTPVECERLQGYPDNWTKYGADGTEIADTARYRAIGNSICVYCPERVYLGILDALEEGTDNGRGCMLHEMGNSNVG